MWIIDWLQKKLGKDEPIPLSGDIFDGIYDNIGVEAFTRQLAFRSAVGMIANSVSKCTFKTFHKGVELREDEFYTWNYAPNKNQNSSEFIHDWINKLYENNEALIVDIDGQLLVADSYQKTEYALYDYRFDGVTVGTLTFERPFFMSDVLYFRLNNKNIRRLIENMLRSWGNLLDYTIQSYRRKRGEKGTVETDANFRGSRDDWEKVNEFIGDQFGPFLKGENAAVAIPVGYKFSTIGNSTYSSENTRDIRALIDDIYVTTARSFCIPPILLLGDVAGAEDATQRFLTFCIDPLCDMLQEEITRKRYGQTGLSQGSYVEIDTRTIQHIDILDMAPAVDKLISSGVYSINELRKFIGEQPVDGDWANYHWVTKNYSTVEDAMAELTSSKG